jgi:SAM-dependent methyltransferase
VNAPDNQTPVSFDNYADKYDESLNQALAITGEDKYYYASERVRRLKEVLAGHNHRVSRILDFGCGTGTAAPYLRDMLGAEKVTGIDPSGESIRVAGMTHPGEEFSFIESKGYLPQAHFDSAYCNGVFHHIPPPERLDAAKSVLHSLQPGGLFALWENNPWNPGTVYVMSRCEFDRDAITLSPPETRQLLRSAGFEIVSTDYLFFFPKALSALRPSEKYLNRVPLGAQYMVLARKPIAAL